MHARRAGQILELSIIYKLLSRHLKSFVRFATARSYCMASLGQTWFVSKRLCGRGSPRTKPPHPQIGFHLYNYLRHFLNACHRLMFLHSKREANAGLFVMRVCCHTRHSSCGSVVIISNSSVLFWIAPFQVRDKFTTLKGESRSASNTRKLGLFLRLDEWMDVRMSGWMPG